MKKIAIIGGGIVGSTAAYYLSKHGNHVTLYDDPTGQATKAAVGIICPWVSQRRNQEWYQLAREGAAFYQRLNKDLNDTSYYRQSGALITHDKLLDKLYNIALQRRIDAPEMGEVEILEGEALQEKLPPFIQCDRALYVSGGAQVDGLKLIETLQKEAESLTVINKRVYWSRQEDRLIVDGQAYDAVILACGAWLQEQFPNKELSVKPQKGQLIEFKNILEPNHNYPVFMPQGEIDFLYGNQGQLVIGATHENEKGFNLDIDPNSSEYLKNEAKKHFPEIDRLEIDHVRVGTRAVSSDFSPFYEEVEGEPGVYQASGLGSSGLTTGVAIGFKIAQSIIKSDKL
ncbi:FAD-dependent oxidoreductase [Erysipelothrix rhusiopathiae]|nr:FAD-dependent oxidoreductase [Erysipelothrix rhusiopathiae]